MEQYTIYCTEEQTKKALELGAPIYTTNEHLYNHPDEYKYWAKVEIQGNSFSARIPIAEQMIEWIEEQGLICDIFPLEDERDKRAFAFRIGIMWNKYESDAQDYTLRKEATLAAIDAALDYLINKKEK